MRRRALLGSAAGLLGAGLAGCLDQSSDGPTTEPAGTTARPAADTTTEPPTTERTSGFDASLDPTVDRHQHGVAVLGVDSVGVKSGSQYVFYRVDVTDGDPPARTDLGFRYGGQVFGPGVQTGGGQLWRASETDTRYTSDRGEGWLVFELPPARSAGHAAFALGSEEWPAPDWLRERLAAPEPPTTVEWGLAADQPGDAARLSFSVTNEGDVDARFVAGLNGVGVGAAHRPVAAFHREVPVGETVSWTLEDADGDPFVASTGDEADAHYHLTWTRGEDDLYVERANGE
ncbi:hypothetical protein [Halobacterium yunchengense]|uniref:hypothetical protein n=1 Tax=Halobacterium yunchengense TaxID=3108497 RepID=UPI00300B61B6